MRGFGESGELLPGGENTKLPPRWGNGPALPGATSPDSGDAQVSRHQSPTGEAGRSLDGYCCSLARYLSVDRQVHLRIGPGVMTRLFYTSARATKNPAIADGVMQSGCCSDDLVGRLQATDDFVHDTNGG